MQLKAHGRGYEIRRSALQRYSVRSTAEAEVLAMIRSGDFASIEVVGSKGEVRTIKGTKTLPGDSDIQGLLDGGDFQTLNITKRNGEVSHVSQTVTTRPAGASNGQ